MIDADETVDQICDSDAIGAFVTALNTCRADESALGKLASLLFRLGKHGSFDITGWIRFAF